MHRFLRTLPKAFNNSFNLMQAAHRSSITKMKLNTMELPKQPVPTLAATAEKYLRSLQPILDDGEFERTEKIVKDFVSESGIGPKLQKELLKKYEMTDNWMSDWWLNSAYLGYRAPVIVHSSPGTVTTLDSVKPDTYLHYAATLVAAILEYQKMIKSGKMKQEMVRDAPLDMQPYGMILGTHRRPCRPIDKLLHTDETKHFIVLHNGQMHKVGLGQCESAEKSKNESQVYSTLKKIVSDTSNPGIPIGILTGNDRDSWALVHEQLLRLGNKEVLQDIEDALFILCLDRPLSQDDLKSKNNASVRANQCMTGVGSWANACNRWHDKTVQYIISPDGLVGMEYEHSPCEGVPVAVLHDFVVNALTARTSFKEEKCEETLPVSRLCFKTDSSIEKDIQKATEAVDKLSKDIDMDCFNFEHFGTDRIKQLKMSPDSFIQVAMQVTFYKLHGRPAVHYESAGLRRFQNARTECIRSTCCESVEFARNVLSGRESWQRLRDLMHDAVNAHKKLANDAALGQGVDRHLFGLKMIASEQGIDCPEIFQDVGYKRSTYFTLTSSQVPYKTASFMCYGPVVPDGYGCCYNPRPKNIFFSCSSFNSSTETNSEKFARALKETLHEMAKFAEAK